MSKILVVEDDSQDFVTVQRALKPAGFELVRAQNLKEAKDELLNFEENPFDILLVDIRLKQNDTENIDGLDFVKYVKKERRDTTPILIYTNNFTNETKKGKSYIEIAQEKGLNAANFRNKSDFDNEIQVVNTISDIIYNYRVEKVELPEYLMHKDLPLCFMASLDELDNLNFSPPNKNALSDAAKVDDLKDVYTFTKIDEVLFVKAAGKKSEFYLKGRKEPICVNQGFGKTMGQICKYHKNMLWCHGSYLVNIQNVKNVVRFDYTETAYVYFNENESEFAKVSKPKWKGFVKTVMPFLSRPYQNNI